jgi:hypothetical protein
MCIYIHTRTDTYLRECFEGIMTLELIYEEEDTCHSKAS